MAFFNPFGGGPFGGGGAFEYPQAPLYDEPRAYSYGQSRHARPRRRDQRNLYATANTGTQYPISDEDLEILQNPKYTANIRPYPPRPISMREAAEQLFAPLPSKQTAEYRAAWKRLIKSSDQSLTYDLLIKMFNDLDTVVFHGDLHFRVCFRWVNPAHWDIPGEIGFTEQPGNFNVDRLNICMSKVTDWSVFPLDFALGVLLHEMLHAYFMVWCRGNTIEREWERGQHPGHGRIFMACARRIGKRMRADLTSTSEELGMGMEHANHGHMGGAPMGNPMRQGPPMMGNPMMGNPMMGNPMMQGSPMMGYPMVQAPMMQGNPMMQAPPMMPAPAQPADGGNPYMGGGRGPTGMMMPPWGMW